ncbi:hypothetical protein HA402_004773 [Bradysia odoriphaga]|nr:hypothetical protein HA402_004773 [Bradysia odoriphaga]
MSIETCNKFSCKDKKVIVKDRRVYDIHIYHNSIQPMTKNPCRNNHCSHLCMLTSNSTYTCGCPTGMVLNVDQISCSATIKKESIYIGLRNYLIMVEHETFGRHHIENSKVVPMYIHKMAFNPLNGHVFIADNIARIIYDYDFVEEMAIELITANVGIVTSMSFDHLSNNLYWADSEHGTVEVYSMNTKHRAILHHYFPAKPIGIAVVPENGRMFVALRTYSGHTHIDIQTLHGGGDHHQIVESQLGGKLIEFAIDRQVNKVYFCDSEMHRISWIDTGESLHPFKNVPAEPISLAVLSEDVFWTSNRSHDVFWTSKHSPDTAKQLVFPHYNYVTNNDRPVLVGVMPTTISSHPCRIDNGGCSHICATYDSKQQICLCPPGMVFSNYRNNTCMEAIDCEFRCDSGECITASRQCNNFKDCADGSDERDCASHEVKCYRDEFKCLDGKQCVAIELRCDKINDCTDLSDEIDCIGYNATTNCHDNQFRCTDGLCIDLTDVCDGINDCEDGLDELKCYDKKAMNNVCKANMFGCANGQCIPAKWVCDEFPDCVDGADELNCTNVPAPVTCEKFDSNNEPLQFQCMSDKTICLNITARCNGIAECPLGEDEAYCSGCRINEFECANKQCIRQEWRCDQQNDCGDRSDEIGCVNETVVTNKTDIGCAPGMFSCRDGNCIYVELVCNGQNDCPNGMDESSACNTSCLNHSCQQMCLPSPFGAVCSCREGFQLGGDGRSCFDINECKLYEPCAQKCENLLGSYSCRCYAGYMLKSDKVSCKSISGHAHIIYSSMNVIYDIDLASLGVLWSSNGSRITGIDVNMRKNLLYFTVEDSNALYEMNLDNKKLLYVTNIGNPHHIAVEWVTGNVYIFDQDTNPAIKVCHMDRQTCIRIITLKYRDVVKSLVVDSINDKIFYSIVHPSYSSADSFIHSHSLDGSREEVIVKGSGHISGLTNDVNKQILYYADLSSSSIWSVRYGGNDRKEILKKNQFIIRPSDLSFYEDQLIILNTGTKMVAVCRTYGNRSCSSFEFSSYNAENLVVVQRSRQREKPNDCHGTNCSLICVPTELGPKCICHDMVGLGKSLFVVTQ